MLMNTRFVQLVISITLFLLSFGVFAQKNDLNKNRLKRVAEENPGLMFIKSHADYRLGEFIGLEVVVPERGWLNIVEVDPDDKITILYPNQHSMDNYIASPGVFRIGSRCRQNTVAECFKLKARSPKGRSLVVALWTRRALNLMGYDAQTDTQSRSLKTALVPASEKTLIQKMAEKIERENASNGLNRSVLMKPNKTMIPDKIMGYLFIDVL